MMRQGILRARNMKSTGNYLKNNLFSSRYCSSVSDSSNSDTPKGSTHTFQAETRQLLDIVTNSIYTDKEVFVRELISNASDALEKLRHVQATGDDITDAEVESNIQIQTDEKNGTITLIDSGIGMTESELIDNLGTIARSGSKAFMEKLTSQASAKDDASAGIIGKFGVGFYSAFMVGKKLEVFTKSAIPGSGEHVWSSDGHGSYTIAETSGTTRGSKIVIHLKDECKEFASPAKIETIIKKYSNFVQYPILLNAKPVNTVQALWAKDAKEVSDKDYTEFYRFISNGFDEPMYRLSFKADAPIELKTLFFVGTSHMEKHGYGRLEPGVSLYSRKVLIEKNSKHILPDWLRFVKGVVDSEDLPLSLSRESMQNTRTIAKIREVLVRRLIKYFDEQSRSDPAKYDKFFEEFGAFLKEGVCSDFQHKDAIAKLLRYESSSMESGKTTSLDEYISRSLPGSEKIYFLCAPSREAALASPYYEAFKQRGEEVLFVYHPMDDFVLNNIGNFNKRAVTSAETAEITTDDETELKGEVLSDEDSTSLSDWLKETLSTKVKNVKITSRLTDSPAVITEHESSSVRRMMSMVNNNAQDSATTKNTLEINPRHPIIMRLSEIKNEDDDLAKIIAEQLYDNSALAAGLIDDGRSMLPRLNMLLSKLASKNATD